MHKHRTPEGLAEHACIDRAVLNLMLDLERQRPWAEDEIARTISVPGDVRDSLRRLRDDKVLTPEDVADAPSLRINSRHGIIDIMRGELPPLDFDTVAERAEATDWGGQTIRVAAQARNLALELRPGPQAVVSGEKDSHHGPFHVAGGLRRLTVATFCMH
jgi:hypothetical protein